MKKGLSVTDILLFTISGIFDFFQEIRDPGNLISNYYRNFYGFIPARWKKIYLQRAIWRNIRKGNIREKKGRLILTSKGKEYLENRFPLYCFKRSFKNNEWWWVIFDIEEVSRSQRDCLRHLLKNLNFIMVQKSVWVTPYKKNCFLVFKYLKERKLEGKILIIKGSFLSEKNHYFLSKKYQKKLKELNQQYKKVYEDLLFALEDYKKKKNKELLRQEYIEGRKKIFQLIQKDLLLPPKLLPRPWYYQKNLEIFKLIWRIIKP